MRDKAWAKQSRSGRGWSRDVRGDGERPLCTSRFSRQREKMGRGSKVMETQPTRARWKWDSKVKGPKDAQMTKDSLDPVDLRSRTWVSSIWRVLRQGLILTLTKWWGFAYVWAWSPAGYLDTYKKNCFTQVGSQGSLATLAQRLSLGLLWFNYGSRCSGICNIASELTPRHFEFASSPISLWLVHHTH